MLVWFSMYTHELTTTPPFLFSRLYGFLRLQDPACDTSLPNLNHRSLLQKVSLGLLSLSHVSWSSGMMGHHRSSRKQHRQDIVAFNYYYRKDKVYANGFTNSKNMFCFARVSRILRRNYNTKANEWTQLCSANWDIFTCCLKPSQKVRKVSS